MKKLLERVIADKPECMMRTVRYADMPERLEYKKFVCLESYNNNASIRLDDINCSDHPDYINLPWLNILETAPRSKQNLAALERNPDYYLGKERKDWCFKEIIFTGNILEVTAPRLFPYHNGNHRTAIAKAFLHYEQVPSIHGITLFREVIDGKAWDAYRHLSVYNGYIDAPFSFGYMDIDIIKRNSSVLEDTDGTYVCSHKLALKLTFRKGSKDKEIIIDANEAPEMVKEIQSFFPLRMLRSNKYAKFLR